MRFTPPSALTARRLCALTTLYALVVRLIAAGGESVHAERRSHSHSRLQVSAAHVPRAGLVRRGEGLHLPLPSGVQPLLPVQMLRPSLHPLHSGKQARIGLLHCDILVSKPSFSKLLIICCCSSSSTFFPQLVWATSSRIGCAVNLCYNMNVWGQIWAKAVYLVCNYSPK